MIPRNLRVFLIVGALIVTLEALWEIDIAFIAAPGISNCPGIPYIWASCFDKQGTVFASDVRIFAAATILLGLALDYHEHSYFRIFMGFVYGCVIFALDEFYLLARDINCLVIRYFCLPSTQYFIIQTLNVEYFVTTLSVLPLSFFAILSRTRKSVLRRILTRKAR